MHLPEIFFSLNDYNKTKRNLILKNKERKKLLSLSALLLRPVPERGTVFSLCVHPLSLVCISVTPYRCVKLEPTLAFEGV